MIGFPRHQRTLGTLTRCSSPKLSKLPSVVARTRSSSFLVNEAFSEKAHSPFNKVVLNDVVDAVKADSLIDAVTRWIIGVGVEHDARSLGHQRLTE